MTRCGLENCATPADPSKNPPFPSPANVVTFADISILRILLLPASLTYKLSIESIVIPVELLNRAAIIEPSTYPITPLPANIERFPDKSILRIA